MGKWDDVPTIIESGKLKKTKLGGVPSIIENEELKTGKRVCVTSIIGGGELVAGKLEREAIIIKSRKRVGI